MEKLVRKLKRELTRSPKKTVVLGGALAVAVYYWAPLVSQWCGFRDVNASEAMEAPVAPLIEQALRPAAVSEGAGVAGAETPSGDWRTWARQLDGHPLRTLVNLSNPSRDPFDLSALQETSNSVELAPESDAEPPQDHMDVDALGLRLEGVLVGGRVRAAIINGRIYRENESIATEDGEDDAPFQEERGAALPGASPSSAPVLVAVEWDSVIIGWNGRTTRLALERATLASGDRILAGEP